jgi:hypothetical protein
MPLPRDFPGPKFMGRPPNGPFDGIDGHRSPVTVGKGWRVCTNTTNLVPLPLPVNRELMEFDQRVVDGMRSMSREAAHRAAGR